MGEGAASIDPESGDLPEIIQSNLESKVGLSEDEGKIHAPNLDVDFFLLTPCQPIINPLSTHYQPIINPSTIYHQLI
jgi:hypothetical protein